MALALEMIFSLGLQHWDAILEGGLWSILLQTLLTGIYMMIYLQTITPLVLTGQERVYASVLTLIFIAITGNLATCWIMLREALILHNGTKFTMADKYVAASVAQKVALGLTARAAIVLADMIMMWRCYNLWARLKILFVIFSLFLLAELALFVILSLPHPSSTDLSLGVPAFYFISSVVTILATVLITLRIIFFSKQTGGLRVSRRYLAIVATMVESGVVYAVSLMATSIFYLIARGERSARAENLAHGMSIWEQALVPLTGIATTLIALRVATECARKGSTSSESKPTSTLQFRAMGTELSPQTRTEIFGEYGCGDGAEFNETEISTSISK